MTIKFILNGEDVTVRASANVRLVDILREKFSLLGAKEGCLCGKCGACSVIFNGYVSLACLIPAFRAEASEIITIEGFSQTLEYQDIATGLELTNNAACNFCRAGKILYIESLFKQFGQPSDRLFREEIERGFGGVMCRCASADDFTEAVNKIAEIRQRRLYGRYT
ncbi:MAG: aldehyde oxidoreductase [Spirochaetes bacterium]|nr:aldehyde oxidoreductase [Spirochaetota bacterium]